jgi:translation initiation factor 1 (eIF-1/SUI1)
MLRWRATRGEDDDMGSVLQLQGDQRDAVEKFLVANEIATKDKIKKHGTG